MKANSSVGTTATAQPIDWEYWHRALEAERLKPHPPGSETFEIPRAIVAHISHPSREDLAWFRKALKDEDRKWVIAALAYDVDSLPEELFVPIMDAGIDEPDPSFDGRFVTPCMRAFGARRVNEYLLKVVECDSDSRKVGAAKAMYWASLSLVYLGAGAKEPTPDSLAAYHALSDVWKRRRIVVLEIFVHNANAEVRKEILRYLEFDPSRYPKRCKRLAEEAMHIALSHQDSEIRQAAYRNLAKKEAEAIPPEATHTTIVFR